MKPRTIAIIGKTQKDAAIAAIQQLPVNQNIEVVIQETKKARTPDQNALMFAGPLKDISEQAWVHGRQYSVDVWHEHCKDAFLPDENNEPYLIELVKHPESYKKFDINPNGERVCVGSTTQLTKYGFSQYLEQVYALGAELGVLFHANPKDYK